MSKAAVYSWRLSPDLKRALTEAAKENHESVAALLERIARDWLERSSSAEDEEEQRRRHSAAMKFLGSIEGSDPDRAANARQLLRARLAQRGRRTAS